MVLRTRINPQTMSTTARGREAVRRLYRRVMRLGLTWEARDPANTARERAYILHEARTLFRHNMNEPDPWLAERLLREGEARVDIAEHYRIPYERASNLPPGTSAYDHQHGQVVVGQAPRYTTQGHPLFDD